MTHCGDCDFVYDSVATADIADTLRAFTPSYREVLGTADRAHVARRPAAGVWSALEYACHIRDVLLVQRDRVVRALVEDRPDIPRMQRDERVAICAYGTEPVPVVLDQLQMADDLLWMVLSRLDAAGWARPLRYYWPWPEEQDVAWVGRHTIHECRHHLIDVRTGLERLRSPD
ncbi:MAG TPA: DinB family protein [Acidimicrobiales bacterium]|nr:DinB family protein [Acidimicrobiales bacterium]